MRWVLQDDGVPIKDTAVVLEAMKMAKALDVPLSFHEEDPALIGSFGVNQGPVSVAVGVRALRRRPKTFWLPETVRWH